MARTSTPSGARSALRHLWSLAVEEQFYLVWPLVMVFLLRRFRNRLGSIALHHRRAGRRLGGVDGAALRTGDRPQPPLLRHGHPAGHAADGRPAGDLLATVGSRARDRAAAREDLRPGGPAGAGDHRVVLRQHLRHQRRAVSGWLRRPGRGVRPRRRRREPSGHRVRPGARRRGPHLDRPALLRVVPLALADLRGDPPGGRRAVRRRPAAGLAAGSDGAAGRPLLPPGGAADPPAGLGAMGPPHHSYRPAGRSPAARARRARPHDGLARGRRGRGARRPATDQRDRAEPPGRPAGDRPCAGHDRRADDERRARRAALRGDVDGGPRCAREGEHPRRTSGRSRGRRRRRRTCLARPPPRRRPPLRSPPPRRRPRRPRLRPPPLRLGPSDRSSPWGTPSCSARRRNCWPRSAPGRW